MTDKTLATPDDIRTLVLHALCAAGSNIANPRKCACSMAPEYVNAACVLPKDETLEVLRAISGLGWQLVPIIPNANMINMAQAMIAAGVRAEGVWEIMIAAAPTLAEVARP